MAEQRVALVVGANRGIGLGVTKQLLARGWDVIATARHAADAAGLQEAEAACPGHISVASLDMSDAAAVDNIPTVLGKRKLDAALLNAGIAGPEHRSANVATVEEIGTLMFVNAIAPVRLARLLIPHMRPGSGVIGFTSSLMGSVAANSGGHELYRASKAALNSLCRGLWTEMEGKRLTLLSLHPGWVRTDMGGSSAPVSVEESAAGIVAMLEKQSGAHQHRFIDYAGRELPW